MKKVMYLSRIVICFIATMTLLVYGRSINLSPEAQMKQKIEEVETAMNKAIEEKTKIEQKYKNLEKKRDQLKMDAHRRTADLYRSIRAKDIEKIKKLVIDGAYLNTKNVSHIALPLHNAAWWGTPEIVKFLIDAGAEVNPTSSERGTNALFKAKTSEVVKILVAAGVDVNKVESSNGYTPLLQACGRTTGTETALALIKAGADVNLAALRGGRTPLLAAAMKRNLQLAVGLLKNGADPNKANNNGKTPLIEAAVHSHNPHFVETLLKNGADSSLKDYKGKTAIDYAREQFRSSPGNAVKKEIFDLLTGPKPLLSPSPVR